MKIATVVGARPQFIKAAALSRELSAHGFANIVIHTGQHYDYGMSRIFFEELDLPEPDVHLGIGSGFQGLQTGRMLEAIEGVLMDSNPDITIVFGDTNTTLAAALAACKIYIPVAHIEAGLRSYNRRMPEEINRVLTDHVSSLLFCPGSNAVENLKREGIIRGVHCVGDIMFDALKHIKDVIDESDATRVLSKLNISPGKYLLCTIHRAVNTDDTKKLSGILDALNRLGEPIVFPLHPRTVRAIDKLEHRFASNVKIIDPVGYRDMLVLEKNARKILTDSGGIQKEAYWLEIPCITLRDETEWPETIEQGWNILVGADTEKIIHAVRDFQPGAAHPTLYGNGDCAESCVQIIRRFMAHEND